MSSSLRYFLQLTECHWPEHIFINKSYNFQISIFSAEHSSATPSLYCLSKQENTNSYPISIELIDKYSNIIHNDIIPFSPSTHPQSLYTVNETSKMIEKSTNACSLSINFSYVPHFKCQPVRFRLTTIPNNRAMVQCIDSYITPEFRVVKYQLRIIHQPRMIFYKDDGGMRNNNLLCTLALENPQTKKTVTGYDVQLSCTLFTEDGTKINGQIKKNSTTNTNTTTKGKIREAPFYLQLHDSCSPPMIDKIHGKCEIRFRINDVSQNHKNQAFYIEIHPDIECNAIFSNVWGTKSSAIIVKSKSPMKLHSMKKYDGKRRSKRIRRKVKQSYLESSEDEKKPEIKKIKMEFDIHPKRKKRKLSVPKSLDAKPKYNEWFIPNAHMSGGTKEEIISNFITKLNSMLMWREWILIGYQNEFIVNDKKRKRAIVRCIVCQAEGLFIANHEQPQHKKHCKFLSLKEMFHDIQNMINMKSDDDDKHLPPMIGTSAVFFPSIYPSSFVPFANHMILPSMNMNLMQMPTIINATNIAQNMQQINMNMHHHHIHHHTNDVKNDTSDVDESNDQSPLFPFASTSPSTMFGNHMSFNIVHPSPVVSIFNQHLASPVFGDSATVVDDDKSHSNEESVNVPMLPPLSITIPHSNRTSAIHLIGKREDGGHIPPLTASLSIATAVSGATHYRSNPPLSNGRDGGNIQPGQRFNLSLGDMNIIPMIANAGSVGSNPHSVVSSTAAVIDDASSSSVSGCNTNAATVGSS